MPNNVFDAIVIGSGISGGWATKELCEKGLKTIMLERGQNIERIKDYVSAIINLKNGSKRKLEIAYGSSFLSQSSRFMIANNAVQSIEVTNRKGEKRTISSSSL